MQRAVSCLALIFVATTTIACADQAHADRALSEVEAVRRESAVREAQLRTLELQQAQLAQQMALLMALVSSKAGEASSKDEERLADLSAQISALTHIVSAWRDEERAKPLDAAAQRAVEQSPTEERAALVRKVQALLDAGQVKLTVKSGQSQLTLLRPIDATDPYVPPPVKKVVPAKPPPSPRRSMDSLGF